MANKRDFKKQLTLVLETVVDECFFTRELVDDKNIEIDAIIANAVEAYQVALAAKEVEKTGKAKSFYSEVKNEFVTKMTGLLEQLEKIQPKI